MPRRARVMPDGEQAVAARLGERAEVRQQPAVRRAAVADREDDAVAALPDRLLERHDGERLGAVAEDEVGELASASRTPTAPPG